MSQCKTETAAEAAGEQADARERALQINARLDGTDLHRGMTERVEGRNVPFRISPEPFWIDESLLREIEALGPTLLRFYEAANRLYLQSVRGSQPDWVRDYLERGKTETVIDYQRMRRFRKDLPAIIRPDILPTDEGLVISELDSVPGGFGLLAALSREYARMGFDVIGGEDGLPVAFYEAVTAGVEAPDPLVAIVVSDESGDYRGEMDWIAASLRAAGRRVVAVHPRELIFREEGLFLPASGGTDNGALERVDVIYRFFELFDLKNIPKIDLILYAARKELVKITPPLKSHLEEKLLFALLHHGALEAFWVDQMGCEPFARCRALFPKSWVVDSRPVPPHAVIPDLSIGGRPVNDWRQLGGATQKERELVLKPSGFSETAWGSRGVVVGHDVPAEVWAISVEEALEAFPTTPHVLQEFRKGKRFVVRYYDFDEDRVKTMAARARLCPYYFVEGESTRLAGVLATLCPADKKVIHGMKDAVMAPVAVRPA